MVGKGVAAGKLSAVGFENDEIQDALSAAGGLTDARDKVRKALVQAKKDVASDKEAVASAEDRLSASESSLDKARSELAYVTRKLAAARGGATSGGPGKDQRALRLS